MSGKLDCGVLSSKWDGAPHTSLDAQIALGVERGKYYESDRVDDSKEPVFRTQPDTCTCGLRETRTTCTGPVHVQTSQNPRVEEGGVGVKSRP